MPPSRFYLSLHQLRAAVGIVQPRLPGVESHLVPLARDAVAANDKELPPPQQTTSHNEILLLALVSKEAPPLVVGGEMGQPSPTSNSNPAPGIGVGDVCFFLTMRCFNDVMFSNS